MKGKNLLCREFKNNEYLYLLTWFYYILIDFFKKYAYNIVRIFT